MTPSPASTRQNSDSLATLLRTLDLGSGHFALILLHCNYTHLQAQLWQILQVQPNLPPLRPVTLPATAQSLLEPLLAAQTDPAAVLVVFDLDQARDLDNLLQATNQVRDEFRKQLTMPLVLWVTDEVLQAMNRCAPDFKSWAATPIRFELPASEAVELWWQTTEQLFADLLAAGCDRFHSNDALGLAPGCRRRRELELARADLQNDDAALLPLSEATWQFVLGRDAFAAQDFDAAIACFQSSLRFWARGGGSSPHPPLQGEDRLYYWGLNLVELANRPPGEAKGACTNPFLHQKALVLVHLGLAYACQARRQADSEAAWRAAQRCWGASLEIFTVKQCPENAAQVISLLCEALTALEAWDALDDLACYALEQPAIATASDRLAAIYAAFARVSLARADAVAAEYWVQLALDIAPLGDVSAASYAGHLLLLAQAKQQLGEAETALQALEQARSLLRAARFSAADLGDDPRESERLYCSVLGHLRACYRDRQQYRLAFQLKQEQQAVEQQCGLRAFQGLYPLTQLEGGSEQQASLLRVSGRLVAVEHLLERLTRSDRKLLVLHGASGTGKSTLLLAGLLPALQGRIFAAREVLTVFQRHYADWEAELCRVFADALRQYRSRAQVLTSAAIPPWLPERVGAGSALERLRHPDSERFFTVFIFDQLEDFFSHHPQPIARQQFGRFLHEALRLPFVKVVLSLRDDCLHELLALEAVDPNVLDDNWLARDNRYLLGDLSRDEAIAAMRHLTERAQLPLEIELIEAVVSDLAGSDRCVRPLELQLVGAQLQSDNIATWVQYQQLGPQPRAVLLARSIEACVADCGPEQEAIAWLVLAALTDARGGRPRRSRATLEQLAGTAAQTALALVLDIFCGSGLILHVARDNSYQLARDYLVEPIRQRLRQRTEQAYARRLQASQLELDRVRRQRWRAAILGGVMAALALAADLLAIQAHHQRQLAQQAAADAEIAALSASSEALFQSGKHFDALLEALRATTRLAALAVSPSPQPLFPGRRGTATPLHQQHFPQATQPRISTATQLRALAALEQALSTVRERNRLQAHADSVWHLAYAADGRQFATASRDGHVKLWQADGRLLATLGNGRENFTSVAYTPDSRYLLASRSDGKVDCWELPDALTTADLLPSPRRRWQIAAHAGPAYSVQVSPDGQRAVTAGEDGTLKLWNLEGERQATLRGHVGGARWASFSPDSRQIASAGKDGTVRLWSAAGELQATLRGHRDKVAQVSFSPDGMWLASAADDGIVSIWERDGRLRRQFQAHEGWALSVQPSPDGRYLLSTGADGAIALWTTEGEQQATLRGHSDIVTSAQFSPDGLTIASSSYDKTVRLWQLPDPKTPTRRALRGHHARLTAIDFAPDSQHLATASADGTVQLWTRQGRALATLRGHAKSVEAVAFSPSGQELASASRDGTVRLWDRQGRWQRTLTGATGELRALTWHPGGEVLAAGGSAGTLWLWQRSGERRERLPLKERVNAIAFSPDGQYLAAASDDRQVWLWQADASGRFDQQPPRQFRGHSSWVLDVAFVPPALQAQFATPPLLASASYDNSIRFWSPTGEMLRELVGHTDSVARLQFDPTGAVLATATWERTLQIWNPDDTLLKTWEGHRERITDISWSPDGSAIATASDDGTALIWELDLTHLRAASCRWLRDYLRQNPRVPERDRQLCD